MKILWWVGVGIRALCGGLVGCKHCVVCVGCGVCGVCVCKV